MKTGMDRRSFLVTSAALAASTALRPRAAAAGPGFAAPTVDRLSIRVVIDSVHDVFLKNEERPGIKIERTPLPSENAHVLQAEWGLSLHLESEKGGERRNYLLDFGWTPDVLANNLAFLGIDPGKLDGLVLSHAHHDHFGGLTGFLKTFRGAMPADMPLYTGGEDAFCYRYTKTPDGYSLTAGFAGFVDRRDLAAENIRAVLAPDPLVIDGHAFTTGVVPMKGIEKILPNTFEEYGAHDGAGCAASHFAPEEQLGRIVPDQHWCEHALCFNVRNRGLVVITACGHRGILNNVRRAQEITGVDKIHVLAGGFHLGPAAPPYLAAVLDELATVDLDYLIPMHCSGANFTAAAQERMPDKLLVSTVGTRFTVAA